MRPLPWIILVSFLVPPRGAVAQLSQIKFPKGFLDLTEIEITARSDRSMTATAYATLLNANTYVMISSAPAEVGSGQDLVLGLKPDAWSLTESIPQLSVVPGLDALKLSNVGLVVSGREIKAASSELHPQEYEFYREVYGSDDFSFTIKPGINLIAAIPVDELEEGHPLVLVTNALGMKSGAILLQGTLGRSLALIGASGSGAADIIKDLYLRAELPPMSPPGAPEWFDSGQLAIELTGDPSFSLVGEMNLNLDEGIRKFFVRGMIATSGLSLSGGMISEEPWESPFGVEWLTLNEIILALGITTSGSLQLGFSGDMVIGEKDIDVAIAVAINLATGAPTNFLFDGESESGVAMSDLVDLQQKMAAAAAATASAVPGADADPSKAPPPGIPLDQLPEMGIENMALKFAPKDSPELNIESGFRVAGDLMLAMKPNAEAEKFASVDVGVADLNLWAKGELGAFTLGPLEMDETVLDLELSLAEQHFILSGNTSFFGAKQALDISVTREALSFESETRLYDLFTADISAKADFNLLAPSFTIDAVAHNDLGDAIVPVVSDGIIRFAEGGQVVANDVAAALEVVEKTLANQEATLDQLKAVLREQRRPAVENLRESERRARRALDAVNTARANRGAAARAYRSTPVRQARLRAQRLATLTQRETALRRARVAFNARRAEVGARRAVLAAIPPVNENVLVVEGDRALGQLRASVERMQTELEHLQQMLEQIMASVERGEAPFSIEHAEFHGQLAAVTAGEVNWRLQGNFAGSPYLLERSLNFGRPIDAVGAIVEGLLAQ